MEHKPTVTLRATLVKAEVSIPQNAITGVIYQSAYKGCYSKYVGETGKSVETKKLQPNTAVWNR